MIIALKVQDPVPYVNGMTEPIESCYDDSGKATEVFHVAPLCW